MSSSDHNHSHDDDESAYPIMWEVVDLSTGLRLGILVKHTHDEAVAEAHKLYSGKMLSVLDTGKRKPPNKCCNICKDKPCGSQ